MTGHTGKGVPYALPTDALIDYPAASLELANIIQAGEYLGIQELTSIVHVVATDASPAAIAGLTVPANGTETHWIEWYMPGCNMPGGGAVLSLWLFDGPTNVGRFYQSYGAGAVSWPVYARTLYRPAAGSRAYTFAASIQTGAVDMQAGPGGAGNWRPGFASVRRAMI